MGRLYRGEVRNLIYSQAIKIINSYKNLTEEKQIIFLYRYISLLITSIAYFYNSSNHSIEKRIFIIGCITIASIIMNYLYVLNNQSNVVIKILVIIETIGNSMLLIPSGGLQSPYVWLALNTVLISSLILNRIYSWINILIYFFCSISTSYIFFNDDRRNLMNIISSEENIIVTLMLMFIAIRLLSRYIKNIQSERRKLLESNLQLVEANYTVKKSISHIIELYQAVNLFSNTTSRHELIELILEHTKKIIVTDMIVFFRYDDQKKIVWTALNDEYNPAFDKLKSKIAGQWHQIFEENSAIELLVDESRYLIIGVKSSYITYGILAVAISSNRRSFNQIEKMDQIKFIADLSSIVLEKFELEKVSEKFLITEEQNRIANEIHDSVLQRLFGTSLAIYGLIKKLNHAGIKEAEADLAVIRELIDHAMKELRATIYDLSWKKDGSDNLLTDIADYINDVKIMHNADINLNIIGNSELIACAFKKAIYRIICEGIGNAVRHGNAKHIDVTLSFKEDAARLRISDDGMGFDFKSVIQSKQVGLGIKNIHFLVESIKGQVNFESTIGKGTVIDIIIPNQINDVREDRVV